jgi:hypothetical protein
VDGDAREKTETITRKARSLALEIISEYFSGETHSVLQVRALQHPKMIAAAEGGHFPNNFIHS